jgi:hypothetical protein
MLTARTYYNRITIVNDHDVNYLVLYYHLPRIVTWLLRAIKHKLNNIYIYSYYVYIHIILLAFMTVCMYVCMYVYYVCTHQFILFYRKLKISMGNNLRKRDHCNLHTLIIHYVRFSFIMRFWQR